MCLDDVTCKIYCSCISTFIGRASVVLLSFVKKKYHKLLPCKYLETSFDVITVIIMFINNYHITLFPKDTSNNKNSNITV